ncbi:MAG: hypothetical protein KAT00_05970 [Planctomycetes bacterium]|nr:hypothetical protein [Planctomycetota bacterium]
MKIRFVMAVVLVLSVSAGAKGIDLRSAEGSGVRVLRNFHGSPDEHGVMGRFDIKMPDFETGVYYRSGWWPAGGNRVYPEIISSQTSGSVMEGGMFLLLKQNEDRYIALLPMACGIAYSWLDSEDGVMVLKMGTHGRDEIEGDIPLYSWATASNPYQACYRAWAEALDCRIIKGNALMREQKEYPEVFEYLGWCSWEQYKGQISEKLLLGAMRDIENSGLGIRFFLVDAGHFDNKSLAPNEKFPNGYKTLTEMRKNDKIRWVGMWYAFLGSHHGITAPGDLGGVSKFMYTCNANKLLPQDNEKAAQEFYEYMINFSARDDIDFVKVDFQTDALPFYAGVSHSNPLRGLPENTGNAIGNPVSAAANAAKVFQDIVQKRMDGLINCNWHNAVSLFFSRSSVVGRCSEDYKVGNLEKAKAHLYHSYASTPWLGQIAWGDHDMFHSNDRFAGRMMAVSKAMSGAPVYLSDAPTEFVPEVIRPLCYEDGLLLRPLAPAGPLRDDLFYALGDERLYRVAAPLNNRTAAIVVYNLTGGVGDDEESLSTVITPKDYSSASAMLQPYPGPWQVPDEGLLVYDWYSGKAQKLKRGYDVSIKGFGDRLLQISPIEKGWSVIGRADKYMSAAAVEVLSVRDDAIRLRMDESGPLLIWSEKGRPGGKRVNFVDLGGGLYRGDMPRGKRDRTGVITR